MCNTLNIFILPLEEILIWLYFNLILNWILNQFRINNNRGDVASLVDGYCSLILRVSQSPFPLQGTPMQAQDVARRISGAVAGEVFVQVKTYQVPITNASPSHLHYLTFASRFPLPHFTLAAWFTLSFPIFFALSFSCLFLFACVLD